MDCSTPGLPVHHQLWSLVKFMSIESVMPYNHLILCRPLLLLPPISPSIKVFSNESAPHIRWPKYWSFSFNISSSSEYSGLISFRMDWLDLLAVQGTLKSLPQHRSSKASILQCSWSRSRWFIMEFSYFFMIQQMLAIWPLVPLHFLNPPWISGSALFMYCWNLAWSI